MALVVAVAHHSVLHLVGLRYPWDTFLFNPDFRFSDWYTSVLYADTGTPYYATAQNALPVGYRTSAYFPFAEFAVYWAGRVSPDASLALFVAISAVLLAAGLWLFCRNHFGLQDEPLPSKVSDERAIWLWLFVLVSASYPVWFAFDRGNIDLWIGGLCLIYIAELKRKRSVVGALALGCAIALKGYPLALVVLGFSQRKFFETGLALLIAVGLTLVGLAFFSGGMIHNWQGFRAGQIEFYNLYVLGSWSPNGTSDPYNGFRTLMWILRHACADFLTGQAMRTGAPLDPNMTSILNHIPNGTMAEQQRRVIAYGYQALTTMFALATSTFVLLVPAPSWRRVTTACLMMILYPHVAGDYKLIVLLPAAFIMLSSAAGEKSLSKATWLLAFLLVPKSYLYLYDKSISMLINPILLVALWWVAISDKSAWRTGWHQLTNPATRSRQYPNRSRDESVEGPRQFRVDRVPTPLSHGPQ
jgi:hypothetical protein